MSIWRGRVCALGLATSLALAARADFIATFEPPEYTGSPAGTVLTGQQGWYLPSGSDAHVYTYAGNALGLTAVNPTGDTQFGAGLCANDYARAQHDYNFSGIASSQVTRIAYDFNCAFQGTNPPPTWVWCGSISLQPSGSSQSILSMRQWTSIVPSGYRIIYGVYTDPANWADRSYTPVIFGNLPTNHWFREEILIDFDAHRIIEVSLTDLETSVRTVHTAPTNWYLRGGPNPTEPRPTGIRFFTGPQQSNVLAYDNFTITAAQPTRAHRPDPGAGSIINVTDVVLRWATGEGAVSHDVYFGNSFDDVRNATPGMEGSFVTNTTGTSHLISSLERGRTYYWRIDERQADGTLFKGDVWSFKTSLIVSVSGSVALARPYPPPSDTQIFVFDERQRVPFVVTQPLDFGHVAPGTLVNSHYLQYDPVSVSGSAGPGTVTFDGPILAVISSTSKLDADLSPDVTANSDSYFGLASTLGPYSGSWRGIFDSAGDDLVVNLGGNTLEVRSLRIIEPGALDCLRILTLAAVDSEGEGTVVIVR